MSEVAVKPRQDYTEGPILSSILKMGLPSAFGFISNSIYSMVDMWWVSRLEGAETGVAAVTFCASIMWLFFSFNQLVGPGSVAIISRRYGEKAYDLAEKAIKETLVLKLFFGIVFGVVGYLFVDKMLIYLGAEAEALEAGISYGQIMFMGMAMMYATYSCYTAMRGVAHPQMAMWLMVGSNVLNLILDPILMFGYLGAPSWGIDLGLPALGIKGAAIASVASYTITFIVCIAMFFSGRTNVSLHLKGRFAISLESMWTLVKIGIPSWAGEMAFSSSRLLVTPLIAAFGTRVVAAYGVGNNITHFGIMLLVGIGLGLSSLIGHNMGRGKFDRAKKTADAAIKLGVVVMSVIGLITYFGARYIMGFFYESPETIEYGVTMLQIYSLCFPFFGAFIMIEEIHMGVGLNTPAMIVMVIHSWPLQVLPMYLCTKVFGLDQTSLWWCVCASAIVSTILLYMYYRRGRWLRVKV